MNRGDMLFVGLGGAGGRLVDDLIEYDGRFQGFFINTSIGDINSLENTSKDTQNYYCISTLNGVGRNRKLGKSFADQSGYNMIDILTRYQQDVIYLVASLGGGSGSSILSVLLEAIEELKTDDNGFDKIINVIAILPNLNSPDVILNNSLETWDEIIDNKGINSIMFVDNSSNIVKSKENQNIEYEVIINNNFIELFNSIFDIPENKSIKFDNGNLGNILRDKGCLYIYDIPNDCTSIEIAMSKAESNSVLAKMYKEDKGINNSNKIIKKEEDNVVTSIDCGYIGTSFLNQEYNKDFFFKRFAFKEEDYDGMNTEKNLLLISGCKPPINSMKLIEHEIEDRKKNKKTKTNSNNSFKINKQDTNNSEEQNDENIQEEKTTTNKNSDNKIVKNAMKKNLFKKRK